MSQWNVLKCYVHVRKNVWKCCVRVREDIRIGNRVWLIVCFIDLHPCVIL